MCERHAGPSWPRAPRCKRPWSPTPNTLAPTHRPARLFLLLGLAAAAWTAFRLALRAVATLAGRAALLIVLRASSLPLLLIGCRSGHLLLLPLRCHRRYSQPTPTPLQPQNQRPPRAPSSQPGFACGSMCRGPNRSLELGRPPQWRRHSVAAAPAGPAPCTLGGPAAPVSMPKPVYHQQNSSVNRHSW